MNTEKWRTGNAGLLAEADRTMYKDKDTVSKSCIDPTRTHLNYNLCPHEQYTMGTIKAINRQIRGKELAKNTIAWGGTVVTMPKDYSGDTKAFFEEAYKGLKSLYKLRDEDIISAYVHLDETTPHMHFYFIPVHHDRENGESVNWNKVMPRSMYKTQHQKLQRYMEDKLHTPVNLINGQTKGVDLQGMTAEEKKLSMRVEKLQKSVKDLRKREISLVNTIAPLEQRADDAEQKLAATESAFARFRTAVSEWVDAHNGLQRILRAAPRLSQPHRDKIETRFEQAVKRGDAVISGADDVDSLLAAAAELERSKQAFGTMRKAVKEDLDIDDLLEDGWER